MKNNKTKINRGLIVMNKGERIAVITLLALIVILMAFSVFRPALRFSNEDMMAFHNLDSLIALQEKAREEEQRRLTMAQNESPGRDSEKESAVKGYTTSSKTGSAPRKTSSPSSSKKSSTPATTSTKKIPVLELNATDSIALVDLPQIGEVMASRIQRYRDRLGGFVSFEQLFEVKGMDSARFATVRPYLTLETSDIRKLDVNRDEFKTLLRHPYLDYDQVKAIVNHREHKGLIRNWEQLKDIAGEVNPLLERYVIY